MKPKQPVEDIVSKLGLDLQPQIKTIELDELLAVLRKHKVADYKSDQFGLHIKLEPQTQTLLGGLASWMPETAPTKTEPDGPELGAVEPATHDLDDVLFGAK